MKPKSTQWEIATRLMIDTISIDTIFLTNDPFLLYSTELTIYDSETDDSWQKIRTYPVPFVSNQNSAECNNLQFSNEKISVHARTTYFISPFVIASTYDYTTRGYKSFDGYLIMKNINQCYSIRALWNGSKLKLGTPRRI